MVEGRAVRVADYDGVEGGAQEVAEVRVGVEERFQVGLAGRVGDGPSALDALGAGVADDGVEVGPSVFTRLPSGGAPSSSRVWAVKEAISAATTWAMICGDSCLFIASVLAY